MKEIISEALFWKHLSDSLLEYIGVEKLEFYEKLQPIKTVWDQENLEMVSFDITQSSRKRTEYIKDSFNRIIVDTKNE